MLEILFGDLGDGDVSDLHLRLADQVQQQVERAVEGVKVDAVVGGGGGGAHAALFVVKTVSRARRVYPLPMQAMTTDKPAKNQMTSDDRAFGARVMRAESDAVLRAAALLDENFDRAVELVVETAGRGGSLVVSGMGKSGLIGAKISATIASVGVPSHVVHPAEAVHGDLGRITKKDCLLALSYSGTTSEVVALASIVRQDGLPVISITRGDDDVALDRLANAALRVGHVEEACPLSLAPTSSTTATLAVGDALALAASRRLDFTADDFAKRHPGGWLGELLRPVTAALRFKAGENLPVVRDTLSVGEALREAESVARRPGAMVLVDDSGVLTGLFTDSDLRRLVLDREGAMDAPIGDVMTRSPKTLHEDATVRDALELIREVRADEIPVVDAEGRPVGVLDVQDLLALRVARG